MRLYSDFSWLVNEYPFRIAFDNEEAIDTGGVTRDMFSGFWKGAFKIFFDGSGSLVPGTHPSVDMSTLPLLGTILSHGFIACGFLPVYISFPVLAAILLGPSVQISDSILCRFFVNYLNCHDASVLKKAFHELDGKTFSQETGSGILSLLSCFGSRQVPSQANLKTLVDSVARHEFLVKRLGALYAMNGGIPIEHKSFWNSMTVDSLMQVYLRSTPTAASVLKIITEPTLSNAAQATAFSFLMQYIGNMKKDELREFLRFVTGSSALIVDEIQITFNGTAGISRAPMAHTCSSILELPASYATYLEFSQEFDAILRDDTSWIMNFI